MAARFHYTKILGFTWRHNNLIKYITGLINIDRFLMYADIPSLTLPLLGGGTVPPPIHVIAEKPDLVIIDRMENKMDIFELILSHWKQILKMPMLKR